jgi:hypothetical protein
MGMRKSTGAVIALMMEAASTFETSVNFYETTWRNIPDDCRREKLVSHHTLSVFVENSTENIRSSEGRKDQFINLGQAYRITTHLYTSPSVLQG